VIDQAGDPEIEGEQRQAGENDAGHDRDQIPARQRAHKASHSDSEASIPVRSGAIKAMPA